MPVRKLLAADINMSTVLLTVVKTQHRLTHSRVSLLQQHKLPVVPDSIISSFNPCRAGGRVDFPPKFRDVTLWLRIRGRERKELLADPADRFFLGGGGSFGGGA